MTFATFIRAAARRRIAPAVTGALAAVMLSAATFPAHAEPAEGRILGAGAPGAVSGSYIVTLKPGARAAGTLTRTYGGRVAETFRTALSGYSLRATATQARRLAADPAVASVAQDTEVHADDTTQADPPSWGLDRIDQPALPLDKSYSYPSSGGAGANVYVIDTGVRISHEEFGGRASYGWDFVDNDATADDGNGHGTHVAATAAGRTYGVAKQAHVTAVRVLDDDGSGTTAQVIAGIDWVARHAKKPAVANMSLGGTVSPQLDQAVRGAIAAGVTFAVAAGNDGLSAALSSPARVREAITVAASDRNDARASFSNWGAAVDLFAPGVDITSAFNTSDTATKTYSGTSMATPHVTGAAALYLAAHPGASPAQVASALTAGAAKDRVSGEGLFTPNLLLQVPKG